MSYFISSVVFNEIFGYEQREVWKYEDLEQLKIKYGEWYAIQFVIQEQING